MVVVVLRFRVAGGLEHEVARALLERPALHPAPAGLLGHEVLRDEDDPATFLLITRWNRLEHFRGWHRLLPAGMPSAFAAHGATLVKLSRLRPLRPPRYGTTAHEVVPALHGLLAHLLEEGDGVPAVILDPRGAIGWANRALAERVGQPAEVLRGMPFAHLLAPEDASRCAELVASEAPRLAYAVLPFTLAAADGTRHPMQWHVQARPDGLALVGHDGAGQGWHTPAVVDDLLAMQADLVRRLRAAERALAHATGDAPRFPEAEDAR